MAPQRTAKQKQLSCRAELVKCAQGELSRALETHQSPAPAAPLPAKPLCCDTGKSLHMPSSQPFPLPPQPVLGFVDLCTAGPELCQSVPRFTAAVLLGV